MPATKWKSLSFEPSEAAPRERIALRIEKYPQGFLVAELDGAGGGPHQQWGH
jgi:hypothetical protein